MWTPPLWSPSVALSLAEQKVAARAAPRKKLLGSSQQKDQMRHSRFGISLM